MPIGFRRVDKKRGSALELTQRCSATSFGPGNVTTQKPRIRFTLTPQGIFSSFFFAPPDAFIPGSQRESNSCHTPKQNTMVPMCGILHRRPLGVLLAALVVCGGHGSGATKSHGGHTAFVPTLECKLVFPSSFDNSAARCSNMET